MTTTIENAICVKDLKKSYDNGFEALKGINLDIKPGEIFALLGPNGAGKTTLISAICGIVNSTSGTVSVCGFDNKSNYRQARECIGLVPQELTVNAFETVWSEVTFSRGLFGKKANPAFIEKLLRDLSLWDKKDNSMRELSGGMKRRVMIAKALSHEPKVLFLDEPSAGVDVELRKSMWRLVEDLRKTGVTIILTTHYIEEAEEIADRIGVIRHGEIVVVEEKDELMNKLGGKEIIFYLKEPLDKIPSALDGFSAKTSAEGFKLHVSYDAQANDGEMHKILNIMHTAKVDYQDISTKQSSLEEIFVQLVGEGDK